MNAFHSSSSNDGEYLGESCGIVIRLEDGRAIYFAGDTCVFGDMALIARLYAPDYAVLPIGDHFTMGPREAAVALELLGNPRCVPCHCGTFPLLTGTPEQLADRGAGRDDRTTSSRAGRSTRCSSRSSRRTRSPRATSTPASGASRRSRSSSPSARSSRGPSRGVGAIATQAYANPRYGPDGLALLARGTRRATEVVAQLTDADDGRDHRQLGVVDAHGGSATLHRRGVHGLGGRRRPATCFAAQGNILVSGETVDGARRRRSRARRGRPLAERLLDCLAAAQAAGGDRRGQQSAALLVVERDGGYAGLSDSVVDLRVDDHPAPVEELAPALPDPPGAVRQDAGGRVARARRRPRDGAARPPRRGSATTATSPTRSAPGPARENLEERVDGIERIDPVVLEELRRAMKRLGGDELRRARLDPALRGIVWHPVRRKLGIRAFGINAYTARGGRAST